VLGVVIDPDKKIRYGHERLQNGVRTDDATSASWRAGARGGFWVQTGMQLVGL
jgi:hypothetical protein